MDVEATTEDRIATAVKHCDVDDAQAIRAELARIMPGARFSETATECLNERLSDEFASTVASLSMDGSASPEREGAIAGLRAVGGCPLALAEMFVAGIEAEGVDVSSTTSECIVAAIEGRKAEFAVDFDDAAAARLFDEAVLPCLG